MPGKVDRQDAGDKTYKCLVQNPQGADYQAALCIVQRVNTTPVHATAHTPTPVPAAQWLRALLLALLAWSALLWGGLGAGAGTVTQPLADKLAPKAQHFQRQTGHSLASRSARRGDWQAIAVQPSAEDWRSVVLDSGGAAMPGARVDLRVVPQQTERPLASLADPHLRPRSPAHPSRAPPVLA